MRKLIVSFFLFGFAFSNAQNSASGQMQLKIGEFIEHNEITIKFNDVLSDSRCPKDAHCIWAGEVVVLVTILKNGKKLEQKKLTLNSTSQLQNITGNLYTTNTFKVTGFTVFPYPHTKAKIDKKEYILKIQID